MTEDHEKIGEMLASLHIKENPYQHLPVYDYKNLQKGLNCAKCASFFFKITHLKCQCLDCGYQELVEKAIIRNVKQFRRLFPNEKLTTNRIAEWCQINPKQWIQRTLKKNFIRKPAVDLLRIKPYKKSRQSR
ncbi:hypothetical protein [Ureibacillus chungkukjangi]|uniref:hypothetical protein n=1 Tax=Ureibacillus chungkukjangi TaxID=1202712 RepID=UPI0011B3FE73|nr:hypothetical protein [Ureibacillus chungkukjangi]